MKHLSSILSECDHSIADAVLHTHSKERPSSFSLPIISRYAANFATHLRVAGVRSGDVVAIQLPAWGEWLIAAYGAMQVGAVILPITSIYGAKELDYILRDAEASLYIAPATWRGVDYRALIASLADFPHLQYRIFIGDQHPDADKKALPWDQMIAEAAPPQPSPAVPDILPSADAITMLVYTSGTTARPKAVQHSSRTLWAELCSQKAVKSIERKEKILSPWPPGHVAGALSMLRFLMGGMDLVLMDIWSAEEAVRLIETHSITSMSTTPFHLSGLLDAAEQQGADLSSLQSLLSGAAPVPPSLIARCEARGLHPFRCYGSSEMPTVSMGRPDDPLEKRLTTEGRLMPDVEIRFLDDEGRDAEAGEIALRGPDLFCGYKNPANNATSFTADGWFLSGDVGRLDADGYLLITDRKKDIIIRGGENISSREIEDALRLHPDIADIAVVAAPDARMGEIVCAFIVTRSGAALSLSDIGAFLAATGLAKQKTPERLEFVADLPRNATGKILKHELRACLRADAAL